VRNFYSASISGYHIAEAGGEPDSQLAFISPTGSLRRGIPGPRHEDRRFAPNLSFFFSYGMEPEYRCWGA